MNPRPSLVRQAQRRKESSPLGNVLRAGVRGRHGGERLAVVLQEEMKFAQEIVVRVLFVRIRPREPEIIGLHRQVVVVGGRRALGLVEVSQFAVGVRSSVIHVVSQKVAAASQFDDSHGISVFGIKEDAAVVGSHHSSAKFAGEVGVFPFVVVVSCGLVLQLFARNGARIAEGAEVECLVIVADSLFGATVPKTVGIVAIERNHFPRREGATAVPATLFRV